jgi:hypothetical protein
VWGSKISGANTTLYGNVLGFDAQGTYAVFSFCEGQSCNGVYGKYRAKGMG